MVGITTYLKLPFSFNIQKLQKDLSKIKHWKSHFNTSGYNGDWKLIALYAPQGDSENIFALNTTDVEISPTDVLMNCFYFQEVISSFKTKIITARIIKLNVGSKIKPHKDHDLGYENGVFRIHIPIITNDKVDFILNGTHLEMKEGQCWYTNVNYTHSVANNGNEDRVHLVIDCVRNNWSDDLFGRLGYDFTQENRVVEEKL